MVKASKFSYNYYTHSHSDSALAQDYGRL